MRLLTLTTLYPNAAAPSHGVFVENRLAALIESAGFSARVIAPVPWFPFTGAVFGRYGRMAAAPRAETRRGIEIAHPRYFLAPKIGMNAAPAALARVFEREARALLDRGEDFDLIDAHYLYPDGVAAVSVARALGKPVVLTARGSDVTLLPNYPRQRAMILDAIIRADAVIAVAAALKDDLVRLGAPAEKITVLGNGVDARRFFPKDRAAIRTAMGLDGLVIASVGSLIDRKGHDIAIDALAELPGATLLIVGDGEARANLMRHAQKKGVEGRVRFTGALAHDGLGEIYNAADILVLASTREGWPNVILEAMASGTPVVVSDAGGSAEVVGNSPAGRIVRERTGAAFAEAIAEISAAAPRLAARAHAELHSWDATSKGQQTLFTAVLARRAAEAKTRFEPINLPEVKKPRLLVTIDTEEIFDWSAFTPADHRVARPADIARFQALCEAAGARPLYFITYPLLTDAETAGYFRTLHEAGKADLGIHLHQWNTPPTGGYVGEYYSWQNNLPPEVHAEKLGALAAAFERAFGFAPRAHRAGRYGVSPAAFAEIAAAGIALDFSPSAAFDFSSRGGPDFSGASNFPFRAHTERGDIAITPVCGALAIRGGKTFLKQPVAAGLNNPREPYSRHLTAPFRLSCEQARLDELAALTESLAAAGTPILTFSLHSTSMTAGANPYAKDAAAVDAMLDLTRRYLEFFTKDFRGEFADFQGLSRLYNAAN